VAGYLRRYTNLPALIYLLREQKITLLDPETWDDKNDSYYLSLYRENKSLKTVLALCFTETPETYHHWRVFADGSSGACVRFDRTAFMKAVKKMPGITAKSVQYLTLQGIRGKKLKNSDLPFLKRAAYEDEREFRLIYESTNTKRSTLDIPIPLGCIDRVTLSPWVHSTLSKHLKETIREIPGCSKLELVRSTLISNERWKNLGEGAR
jgi:hypothetical protein